MSDGLCRRRIKKGTSEKLQNISRYQPVFLEAIPVKKDLEDDIFHNNGERKMKKALLKKIPVWKPVLRINNIWNFADKTI